jgi:2-dehydro-3-deoxyglucarate aldolase/4-hydroxy-2-oxoheptanedioate aldolase
VIVQVETAAALDRLDEIAAVPGVDSIFIGPADLSASMGLIGDVANAAVQEKLAAGAAACRRLGKPCGIVGATPETVGRFLEYGYSWVAIGSDMSLMVGRAQEYLARVRGAAAPSPSPDAY